MACRRNRDLLLLKNLNKPSLDNILFFLNIDGKEKLQKLQLNHHLKHPAKALV